MLALEFVFIQVRLLLYRSGVRSRSRFVFTMRVKTEQDTDRRFSLFSYLTSLICRGEVYSIPITQYK